MSPAALSFVTDVATKANDLVHTNTRFRFTDMEAPGLLVAALGSSGRDVYAINPVALADTADGTRCPARNATPKMPRHWAISFARTATPTVLCPETDPVHCQWSHERNKTPSGIGSSTPTASAPFCASTILRR